MQAEYLLLPSRKSRDYDVLSEACFWAGINVTRIEPGSEALLPDGCVLGNTAIRGGTSFCRNVAAALGGVALEPADNFLPSLSPIYTNRRITLTSLAEARLLREPKFIKPVNDKHFPAGVYNSGADLPETKTGDEMAAIVSDPVIWRCEYRTFVLNQEIQTSSAYGLPDGQQTDENDHAAALHFAQTVLVDSDISLPRAVVLDVGWIDGKGWSVVEANTVTMSGIYDCEPLAVIDVLLHGIAPLP